MELRKARKDEQLLKRRNLNIGKESQNSVSESDHLLLSSIDEIVNGMKSLDETIRLQATQTCRKMLSREKSPPIDNMIQRGIVPLCVEFLDYHHKYIYIYIHIYNNFVLILFSVCVKYYLY